MRNTRTRRHPIIIVGAGADFEEIGRDIAALSPEHLVPIFAGMITRIREEGNGDAVRGRTRLSGLLGARLMPRRECTPVS
ncbi:MAG: hypothetical protein HGA38_01855 [Candidatus Moranbacteria bacterium]|nr:hypothetical protein [Candidatus Moranbacteria bacterium]